MENDVLETVLTEILEELKQARDLAKENNALATEHNIKLVIVEKIIEGKEAVKPRTVDSVDRANAKAIEEIKSSIMSLPGNTRREFRILLFPEYNTKEYYKIVFGSVIFWLVVLVISKYLYLLGNEWILKSYEEQRYKKSWDILYRHQDKSTQRIMETIFNLNTR